MNQFSVGDVGACIANLQSLSCRCHQIETESGRGSPANTALLEKVTYTLNEVRRLGVRSAPDDWPKFHCRRLAASAQRDIATNSDVTAIRTHLQVITNQILKDVTEFGFLWIAKDKRAYVDAPELFGPEVKTTFHGAAGDITEAGNCLAVGCSTAAVFHLMRVSEHGLRHVARKLKVQLTHKGLKQPLEYADWNTVITGIKRKITSLRALSRGPKQDRQLNFYSDIAEQAEYIKDIWRNTISHARRAYNSDEAMGVKIRVQDFMVRIARGPAA